MHMLRLLHFVLISSVAGALSTARDCKCVCPLSYLDHTRVISLTYTVAIGSMLALLAGMGIFQRDSLWSPDPHCAISFRLLPV